MKKSLIAIAVLGAAAFSAQAANVTLYGTVDAGFAYSHNKVKATGAEDVTTNSFKMANGLDGANKIGIKGEEDLGNMKVGFKLENQFYLSNGNLKDKNKLFSREARMYVKSELGEISAGRFGGLASAAGSYDIFFAQADAFDGGDNAIKDGFSQSGRMDNAIAYQSPEVAGFQGTLMYSFREEGDQADKMKHNNRYFGAGLTYNYGNLNLVGVVEGHLINKGEIADDNPYVKDERHKDGITYNIGANYDFGVAKVLGGFQYARHVQIGTIETPMSDLGLAQVDGYAGTLGVQVPFSNSNLTVGAYYSEFKNAFDAATVHDVLVDKKDAKLQNYGLSARYKYNLSKRSSVYAGAGLGEAKLTAKDKTFKTQVAQVYLGLRHNF